MFEKYYRKLRFSQKTSDKSIVACMRMIENNRKYVLNYMKDKKVNCHKGCNLCCQSFTLMVNTIDSYILLRIFEKIPYNELIIYYRNCAEKRVIAQDYINSLPECEDFNYPLEAYNKLGFTTQTCPFVDGHNGCLIHEFSPQVCFSYYSSVPCKITIHPDMNNEQKTRHDAIKEKAESTVLMGLENDRYKFQFDNGFTESLNIHKDFAKIINQDILLEELLRNKARFEMLTLLSLALKKSNPEKFMNDAEKLDIFLIAEINGQINYL